MIGRMMFAFATAGLFALGACADTTRLSSAPTAAAPFGETVAWSVGPCFGFCPVYKVEVDAKGTVTFDGERHTAVLGRKVREGGPDAYRAIADALATYRPTTGATVQTTCEQQISDSSSYVLTWTRPDGTVTTLRHDKGCRSTRNDGLNSALQALPQRLGIAGWAAQTTRAGVSRG
jgi:hypothetical protein